MSEKTIEQIYQKKTPLEHILLRPDTYVGSIEMEKSTKWILPNDALKFQLKDIFYVPALFKIFDEVLVNAADNYQRDRKMNLLKVEINSEKGYVSVHNNGKGIPVSMHKDEKMYVAELIFGHLLTGSNYNDDEKKVVGGRNGYGAKLANIFSTKFEVQCGDGHAKKKFRMEWKKNMTVHSQAQITSYSGKDFTTVTFYPEFKRFGMQQFDEDIVALFHKRVYDMAGLLPSVRVFLNQKQLPVNSFLKYVNMYFPHESQIPKIRDQNVDSNRWEIVVSLSEGEFRQVSFVNGICTTKGGTHVNYIVDQIVQKIQDKLKKKDKTLQVKPFQIKAHLWVFINCLIENPAFDSQTKQTLTLKQSQFGSTCQLSQKLIKQILKTGIVDQIFQQAKAKEFSKLAKATGGQKKSKLTGIPKLQDANDAGTRNSQKCTLILTEGDSAKSLAMAGLSVIGRDHYGVFPLKGKLLNVREANNKTLMANQQIQNLLKILGLTIGKKYEDLKSLRYGALMIMSDQDTDGSHIKGLVINFIHYFWPSLFQINGFLKQFITPLLKVTKGSQCISFYTMKDFKTWSEQIVNLKVWKIKYYKGLGTSTDKQAQQYFQNLHKNKIDFIYQGHPDDEAIDLIFNKKLAERRKEWLSHYDPQEVMVYDRPRICYKQFVDRQFIHFSNEDNNRSIASIIDGFKPGQRKIIFSCFKRNLREEIKVAQLAGYVSEHSAYHHGQMSLTMTIVNMAQNFVGSNNINLLLPNGQFGSRNQGGKDHASARYIFTNLSKVTRAIFPQPDDHTLTYLQDDGQIVQPQYYIPIIPMNLVNGCEGIGSGWSTMIPNHCPREIAEMIRRKLIQGEPFGQLSPWYKGFQGQITRKEDGNYQIKGIFQYDEDNPNIIRIKELPINKWTKDYKIYIDQIMQEGDTKIVGLKEYHTKNKVHFEIQMNEQFMDAHRGNTEFFEKFFKLNNNLSMKNMVGFNKDKKLVRYASTTSIMEEFYEVRLEFYDKRKRYLISKLQRQVAILSNKARFIIQIVEETLIIRNVKKIKIVQILKERKYLKFSQLPPIKSTKSVRGDAKEEEDKDKEDQSNQQDQSKEYNYLLQLPLWSLTFEKVQEIKKQMEEKNNQLKTLQLTKISEMWNADLVQFLKILDKVEQEELIEIKKQDQKANKISVKGQKAKKKNAPAKGDKSKDKTKKQTEKINWDSQSDFVETKQQPKTGRGKSKAKQNGKTKDDKKIVEKTADPKKKSEQDNDLISRMKKKFEVAKKQAELQGTTIVAKPVNSKKSIEDYFAGKQSNEFEIVTVSRVPKAKKKKMAIDSDEEDQESWSQGQDK